MVVAELRTRAEMPVDDTWDLSALYTSDDDWERELEGIRAALPSLEAQRGTLGEGPRRLLEALRLQESVGQRMTRAYSYAGLTKDQDNTDNHAVAMYDRVVGLSVQLGQAVSWVEPEILALPDGTVERYLQDEPELAIYRHVLEDLLRQKEHVLSAEMESLLASAGEVTMAPNAIFTMLNNADMTHGTIVDEDGNDVPLTKGSYQRYMESRSRETRRQAFTGMHEAYLAHRNTLATTYSSSVKTDIFLARAHKYETALQASLEPNNIPVAVYDNLLEVVNRRLPLLHRYVALRKRTLGLDELQVWDLYVPIVPEVKAEYSWETATDIVMRALAPLGDDYRSVLAGAFDSRWVDVYENKGKTAGAYSWGVYGVHPFILMNWAGRLDDVFTLGHEVGHALHSHYTSAAQPFTYGRYTLFVAEVASTVNEMLMTAAMRRETDDRAVQMYLVNHALEDFRSTLFRQTMFAEFERWSHEHVESGGALTPDVLSEHYAELCRRYYGPDVTVGEHTAIEWARIPHFYRAFYVYQYATGISAASALAAGIMAEGEPARRRYVDFLSGGSSKYSLDLLRDAGVDMTTPEPIERALDMFDALLTELEALMAE